MMIEFDKDDMTLWQRLDQKEAHAFVLFLESERRRHLRDVDEVTYKIEMLKKLFDLENEDAIEDNRK